MSRHHIYFLLANRFSKDKKSNVSRPIITFSIIGVALGLITMILALVVTSGYKKEIRDMVISMGSHIRISNYDNNYSFEPIPFEREQFFIEDLKRNPHVKQLQFFSTKVGIIKTEDQVEGIVLKGIDTTFYWEHFQKNIKQGERIMLHDTTPSSEILISSKISKKLNIEIGDKVRTYFVQDPPMQRSFTVAGIFETGLPEFDDSFVLVDMRHVQKLNGWDNTMIGGIEILIDDYGQIDKVGEEINGMIGYNLKAETIKQTYPQILEWIALFDTNVIVLLVITIFVCIITMISAFLIIALEQTSTIGILKTMGMKNNDIIPVFLLMAFRILFKGLLIGNAVALSFSFLQKHLHFVKLDPSTYYVAYVPIHINPWVMLGINAGVIIVCMIVLLLPAYYISKKTSPVKAIKFD